MAKRSAGLMMYRRRGDGGGLEVLLVHPGGPFWAKKDKGAWTVPKGEPEAGEELLQAARREFAEETGMVAEGPFVEVGTIRQASGKVVSVWGFAGDCDPAALRSNTCRVEWPPRSGKEIEIPEVDRGAWFGMERAAEYLLESQRGLVRMLVAAVEAAGG